MSITLRSAYLAGPMRGYEEYNFPAFRTAADWLRRNGWRVTSPAELDEADPNMPSDEDIEDGRALDYFMARDLRAVCQTDCLILLPGWEQSQGARLEAMVAVEVGHPVFEIEEQKSIWQRVVRRGLRSVDNARVAAEFIAGTRAYDELPMLSMSAEPWVAAVEGAIPQLASEVPESLVGPVNPFQEDALQDWLAFQDEGQAAPDRHPNSARFHEILTELGALHDRKQQDYGRGDDPFANVRGAEEWDVPGWIGAMVRANDKIRRLQTYAVKGSLSNEGAEDSFRDLAVYAIIALVLWEQSQAELWGPAIPAEASEVEGLA